MSIHQTLDFIA